MSEFIYGITAKAENGKTYKLMPATNCDCNGCDFKPGECLSQMNSDDCTASDVFGIWKEADAV